MACNCTKKTGSQSFVFTHPTTKVTTTYRTEIEARAAQIRYGGGSIAVVAR